jgi:23S rRNA (cytosine1962-C5)-methyltransferase
MQLKYKEFDDFLVFNKPFGVRTHKVDENQFGFVEYLSEKLQRELWVVHRLDKGTSGLMLFATSKTAAAELRELFENHQIKKTYVFLTDKKHSEKKFTVTSFIEKQDQFFVNVEGKSPNSETQFEFVSEQGSYNLWKALPTTGKPHQIRLHAQKAGIPILGDSEHAGSLHHRLALHAEQIEFSWHGKSISAANTPPSMTSLFADCFYSRHSLFNINANESYRLIHKEHPELRADVFTDRLWVYDYSVKGLSEKTKDEIKTFAKQKRLKLIIRHMMDRGQGVGGLEKSTLESENSESWVAYEESVPYRLKTDSGFSPGLFLDQRENRLYVRRNSQNKKVLNLFSYTSGFSVNAALGGAEKVTTVDVSEKFLNWSRENFQLNDLNPTQHEFFCQDSVLFLKGAVKRSRKWDLIICDPPSFGRSKDSVWKIEKDLPFLAEQLLNCLEVNGEIIFTCNLEKKTRTEIIKLFCTNLKKFKYTIESLPMQSLDFEETDEFASLMKGFRLVKK